MAQRSTKIRKPTPKKQIKSKKKSLRNTPKINNKLVLAIILVCAIAGGLAVFRSRAASLPYSRLDCTQAQSNKGYSSLPQCYAHSIEGSTAQAFIAVLGRKPEKTALQYWSNVYSSYRSGPQQTLINKLLSGSEAQVKFTKLPSSDEKVKYLYNTILQRKPDSSGAKYWKNRIEKDKNIGQTIAAFINTPQAISKLQPLTMESISSLPGNWRPSRMSKPVAARGIYSNWNWSPPASGYSILEHDLTVNSIKEPSSYFWAHQFKFIGGDGGYIGLQSTSVPDGKNYKRQAIFSIFGAGIAAKQPYCKVEKSGFDGYNTSGTSCIITYNWIKNHVYHLKTSRVASDASGTWWSGWVVDKNTGSQTLIGTIKVPGKWRGFGNWSVMWTENYYSTAPTCGHIPYSNVRFSNPVANGYIKPVSASQSLSKLFECTNSIIKSGVSGVVQEVGSVK
jgi:hypothetical protein